MSLASAIVYRANAQTTVWGEGEADVFEVSPVSSPTILNGGSQTTDSASAAVDAANDTIRLAFSSNPSASSFGNLSYTIGKLEVDVTGTPTSTPWNVIDGFVHANGVQVLDTLGAETLRFIGAGHNLGIEERANVSQTISIETDQVRIEEGTNVLVFDDATGATRAPYPVDRGW